ncbi:NIL domain-containing protein [Micromonospora sp. NPDC000018]|uniref:NIL domain-containing protein n=1 Tax=Micromonospora sp. NPDC000018 TaxID=3154239 RepID=UPI00332B163C
MAELPAFVGLTDKAWVYPDQLSGGQKQRVGIARALATNPKILLADESTSTLDPETTQEVLRLLKRVNTDLGVTVVVITHEMDVVRRIADRVAVLDSGRVVETGATYDVFSNPQTDTARRFASTVLPDRPEAADLARLRDQHRDATLVRVATDGSGAVGQVLAEAVRQCDLRFEIVHGAITALQGRSFGNMTLALSGTSGGGRQGRRPTGHGSEGGGAGVSERSERTIRLSSWVPHGAAERWRERGLGPTLAGTGAATFPLLIAATFGISRIVEQNLVTIDPGVIEAAQSMGASSLRIIVTLLISETLGPLVLGYTSSSSPLST